MSPRQQALPRPALSLLESLGVHFSKVFVAWAPPQTNDTTVSGDRAWTSVVLRGPQCFCHGAKVTGCYPRLGLGFPGSLEITRCSPPTPMPEYVQWWEGLSHNQTLLCTAGPSSFFCYPLQFSTGLLSTWCLWALCWLTCFSLWILLLFYLGSLRSSRTSLTLHRPHDDPQMCIFKGRRKLQAVLFPHRAGFPARTPTAEGQYPLASHVWRALVDPSPGASWAGSGRPQSGFWVGGLRSTLRS